MAPVTDTLYLERARIALSLAGRALDPNRDTVATDVALGAELLCRALANAVRAIAPATDPSADLCDAVSRLPDELLAEVAGNRAHAVSVTSDLVAASKSEAAEPAVVASGERFIDRLIARVHRGGRKRRIFGWAMLGAVALVTLSAGAYAMTPSAEDKLTFRASSGSNGYAATGTIGNLGRYGIFVHTKQEKTPWVEIDLGHERLLSQVEIINRPDCCSERAIPLVVSVRTEDGELHEVARRTANFDTWEARFPTEKARYVRLSVPRETILHLKAVHFTVDPDGAP